MTLMRKISEITMLVSIAVGSLVLGSALAQNLKPFNHVFVIMMENTGVKGVIGNPTMPFVNHLVQTYGYADNYFGVTHPSMPNYIAITSGSNYYSHSDNPAQMFPHTNIADEMEAVGLTWKGYMQSLPYAGYTGAAYPTGVKNPLYVNKHDPFVLYPQIKNNPQRMENVVPLKQLASDLASGQVPNLSFITPNICNDMHGMGGTQCNYSDLAKLSQLGDATIKSLVTSIMNSPAWTGNSAIFITWDEGSYNGNKATSGWAYTSGGPDSPVLQPGSKPFPQGGVYGGGNIPMIVISHQYPYHYVSHVLYNHYSLLRTLEQAWGLPYLGYTSDTMQVKALTPFFEFQTH